jgi:hypothetical protein
MTIFNSYVKLPEGTISMNLQSILPHKNDDYDHGVFSSPVHEKPASQPRLASTRHQDAKGQGDPRQRWDLYTGLPALSGFVASVGGLLLLVKRNETNVSPLKGWYNCITLARYGYATNRYIYIHVYIHIYIYIGLVMEEHYVDFGQQTQGPSTVCRAEFRWNQEPENGVIRRGPTFKCDLLLHG